MIITLTSNGKTVTCDITHTNNLTDSGVYTKNNLILQNKTNVKFAFSWDSSSWGTDWVEEIVVMFQEDTQDFITGPTSYCSRSELKSKNSWSCEYCPSKSGVLTFTIIIFFGESDTKNYSATIAPFTSEYVRPKLSDVEIFRCDASGVRNDKNGKHLIIQYKSSHQGSISYTNDGTNNLLLTNNATILCTIKESQSNTTHTATLNSSATSGLLYTYNTHSDNRLPEFNPKRSAVVTVKATDEFGESDEVEYIVEVGCAGFHISDTHKAIGIGGSAREQDNTVSFRYDAFFDGTATFKKDITFNGHNMFMNGIVPIKLFDVTNAINNSRLWGTKDSTKTLSVVSGALKKAWNIDSKGNGNELSFQNYLHGIDNLTDAQKKQLREDISQIGKYNMLLCEVAVFRTGYSSNSQSEQPMIDVVTVPLYRHLGYKQSVVINKEWGEFGNPESPIPLQEAENVIAFTGGTTSYFDSYQPLTLGLNLYVLTAEGSIDPYPNKESNAPNRSGDIIAVGNATVHLFSPYSYDNAQRYHSFNEEDNITKILSIYGLF